MPSLPLCLPVSPRSPGLADPTLEAALCWRNHGPYTNSSVQPAYLIPFAWPAGIPSDLLAGFCPLVVPALASSTCFLVVSGTLPFVSLWMPTLVFFWNDTQTALLKLYLQSDCVAHHINNLKNHTHRMAQLCLCSQRSRWVLVTFKICSD